MAGCIDSCRVLSSSRIDLRATSSALTGMTWEEGEEEGVRREVGKRHFRVGRFAVP